MGISVAELIRQAGTMLQRGTPKVLFCDNGSEFASQAIGGRNASTLTGSQL